MIVSRSKHEDSTPMIKAQSGRIKTSMQHQDQILTLKLTQVSIKIESKEEVLEYVRLP